jgi:membrane protein
MPNTKVRFRAGLVGGIFAGLIYQIVQLAYITFQIGVSKYGAIYGSFAALPLFLVWLQISWLIVLFGAEISFAFQNVDTYEFEPDCLKVKPSFKKLLALRIVHACVQNFSNGDRPWSAEQISHVLEIPIRLVNLILFELVQCNVLSEAREVRDGETLFQPAVNTDRLSIHYVIQALENLGTGDIPVAQSRELDKLSEILEEFTQHIEKSEANILLKDI